MKPPALPFLSQDFGVLHLLRSFFKLWKCRLIPQLQIPDFWSIYLGFLWIRNSVFFFFFFKGSNLYSEPCLFCSAYYEPSIQNLRGADIPWWCRDSLMFPKWQFFPPRIDEYAVHLTVTPKCLQLRLSGQYHIREDVH